MAAMPAHKSSQKIRKSRDRVCSAPNRLLACESQRRHPYCARPAATVSALWIKPSQSRFHAIGITECSPMRSAAPVPRATPRPSIATADILLGRDARCGARQTHPQRICSNKTPAHKFLKCCVLACASAAALRPKACCLMIVIHYSELLVAFGAFSFQVARGCIRELRFLDAAAQTSRCARSAVHLPRLYPGPARRRFACCHCDPVPSHVIVNTASARRYLRLTHWLTGLQARALWRRASRATLAWWCCQQGTCCARTLRKRHRSACAAWQLHHACAAGQEGQHVHQCRRAGARRGMSRRAGADADGCSSSTTCCTTSWPSTPPRPCCWTVPQPALLQSVMPHAQASRATRRRRTRSASA